MLQNKALLFSLSIKLGRRAEQDKDTTAEVLLAKNAKKGACSVSKKFFPPTAFKEITKLGGQWSRECAKLTLPWDDANRLCPASAHDKVQKVCNDYAPKWEALKDKFLAEDYPTHAATAPERMGALYDSEEFPSLEEMREDMGAGFSFLPIGDCDAIRLPGLTEDQAAKIREEAAREMETREEAAKAEQWRRFLDPVRRFVERLSQPDAVISQPSVDAIRDIVALTESVNLGDAALEEFRREVNSRLATWDAAVVRGNPRLRSQMAAEGRELLQKLGGRKLMLPVEPEPEPATTVAA